MSSTESVACFTRCQQTSHSPHLSFARRCERNTDAKYMFRMAMRT